ncbi:unnamed protein product, partial [marine sediment metagenome]
NDIEVIKDVLEENGIHKIKHFKWPPVLNSEYYAEIEELDWVIIDIGETTMRSGIVGYLHGCFIPMLRLLKGFNSIDQIKNQECFQGLYGGLEVGYQKDIIVWETLKSLKRDIESRLITILETPKRISTIVEGKEYFSKAALRKDAVFLSYSGNDDSYASELSLELKKRFQRVFDYKDSESITPGEPWLKEIFDRLSTSALGILLVSSNYLASGNCKHEAQEIISMSD